MSFHYFEHRNIYRVLLGLKSQKSCRNGSVNSMRAYPSRAFVFFFFYSFLKPEGAPHCTDIAFRFSGLAIRHRGDYATILLLDKRYGSAKIKKSLPGWISDRLQHHARFGSAFAAIRKVNLL